MQLVSWFRRPSGPTGRARSLFVGAPLANPPARLIGIATARLLDAALPPPWHARQAFALARRSRGGGLAAV